MRLRFLRYVTLIKFRKLITFHFDIDKTSTDRITLITIIFFPLIRYLFSRKTPVQMRQMPEDLRGQIEPPIAHMLHLRLRRMLRDVPRTNGIDSAQIVPHRKKTLQVRRMSQQFHQVYRVPHPQTNPLGREALQVRGVQLDFHENNELEATQTYTFGGKVFPVRRLQPDVHEARALDGTQAIAHWGEAVQVR